MHVKLIRHSITASNAVFRYVGVTDEPLSEEGVALAQSRPKDLSLSRVFVSPLCRARQTAAILFPNAEQIVVEGFKEMDFGVFEGRTADEMENDPVYRAWVDDLCRGACPGGESQETFHARVKDAFVETMQKTRADATVVAHGGVIMSILYQLAEPKKDFYEWAAPNLGGFEADLVQTDGGFALQNVRPL